MAAASRVVSLVPSLTELVWWLGAGDRLVGRTLFCTEPRGRIEGVPALGGTKNPDLAGIVAREPDLVLANREENRKEDVEALRAAGLPVLLTDPVTIADAIEMVLALGDLLGSPRPAQALAAETRQALAAVGPAGGAPRVCVLIWKRPWMALGHGTYGNDLLERCGAENVFSGRPRYPEVTLEEVRATRPRALLLPDEPYRFRESDAHALGSIAPATLVDGRQLWWYGPRMPGAIHFLRGLLASIADG